MDSTDLASPGPSYRAGCPSCRGRLIHASWRRALNHPAPAGLELRPRAWKMRPWLRCALRWSHVISASESRRGIRSLIDHSEVEGHGGHRRLTRGRTAPEVQPVRHGIAWYVEHQDAGGAITRK